MIYNKIKIYPNGKDWSYNITELPGDMVNRLKPSAHGVYCYEKDSEDPKKAFDKLKAVMIKAHNDEINRLNDSLSKLKNLEYNGII